MEALTITVSAIASLLAFALNPVQGLCVYIVTLFCYPQTMSVEVGTLDFNASRFVILFLMANVVFKSQCYKNFKVNSLDVMVIVFFIGTIIALLFNVPVSRFAERESGRFVNTILPYFAVRLSIKNKDDVLLAFRWLIYSSVPLALIGIVQSVTGFNLYNLISPYHVHEGYVRYGLNRAIGSFNHPIVFGLFFAGVMPICAGFLRQPGEKRSFATVAIVLSLVGIFSSLSSAPFFSCFVSLFMFGFFYFRRYWWALLVLFLGFCVFVEVFSNRHFYHVLTRLAFDGDTAYYRIGLIEEAFGGGMKGHWLQGYGYVGLGSGNDNANFKWEHQDLVNIYIGMLAHFGLLSTLPYLIINVLYYQRLIQGFRIAQTLSDKWLIWCVASALVGWNVAMLTVPPISQIEQMLFMFIGLCGDFPAIFMEAHQQAQQAAALQMPNRFRNLRKFNPINPTP